MDQPLYRTDTDCNSSLSRGFVVGGQSGWLCASTGLGSSFAAPVVTSAAAVVYDWAVATFGSVSASGVGKLHAMMLGMGDAHDLDPGDTVTVQRMTGADRRYGLGRLKVRKPTSAILSGLYLTDGSTNTVQLSTSPYPAGYNLVKCVALLHEDMSSKSRTSHVEMKLSLRWPVLGSCSLSGPLSSQATDNSYDVKKMTRVPGASVAGKCAYLTATGTDVEGTSVSGSLFCYAANEDDDEPN